MKYRVAEIFDSLIGEGFHVGTPATFVRLSGCNLACAFCDTNFGEREQLTAPEIAARVNHSVVVLTGGEPLSQDVVELVDVLHKQNRIVHVETNGMFPLPWVDLDWVCVSPKGLRRLQLTRADECKVVLGTVPPEEVRNIVFADHWWIQPMSEDFAPAVEYVLEHPWWRLSVQTHKVLGVK